MLRRADIAESTYEPYHETVDECKFDRSEQRVLGAKNLFNAYDPSTAANVTVTDNGRSINMLRATPTAWLNRQWDVYLPKNTDFILYTRAEKTVGKSGVTVRAQDRSTQIYNAGTSDDAVKIYKFTFNTGNNDFVNIVLNASTSTAEAGDVTYKDFMIRLASDPDDTYAPYAMTNRELTETHDEWTAEETVSSDLRVTFAGLNDAYGYSTPCVQDKLVSVTSMIKAGRDTNVALTFTLSGATAGDKAKLRIFK
jgi:hypothetical protein